MLNNFKFGLINLKLKMQFGNFLNKGLAPFKIPPDGWTRGQPLLTPVFYFTMECPKTRFGKANSRALPVQTAFPKSSYSFIPLENKTEIE
jgi:hypothetical protein